MNLCPMMQKKLSQELSMDRYDADTKEFFSDLLKEGAKKKETEEREGRTLTEQLTRQAVGVARDIGRGKSIPTSIVRRAIGTGTIALLEKESALPPLKIYEILNDHYDWTDWEPETIWTMLEVEHGIKPSDEAKNIVQALQTAIHTNFPFEEWHIFENVGHAFNENPVNFGQVQPLELDEIAKTVKILTTLRPKQEFEDEVLGYIAACAKNSGVVYLPEDLFPKGCQDALDRLGNDIGLRDQVKAGAAGEPDSPLGVQNARLKEIRQYKDG